MCNSLWLMSHLILMPINAFDALILYCRLLPVIRPLASVAEAKTPMEAFMNGLTNLVLLNDHNLNVKASFACPFRFQARPR